jgi:molybdate transport system regulatory protein
VFGEGRYQILLALDELGSLAEVSRHLGMSYRAVWGKINATEERLGVKLVVRNSGRSKSNNTTLTPAARYLIEKFAKLEAATRAFCEGAADEVLNYHFREDGEAADNIPD